MRFRTPAVLAAAVLLGACAGGRPPGTALGMQPAPLLALRSGYGPPVATVRLPAPAYVALVQLRDDGTARPVTGGRRLPAGTHELPVNGLAHLDLRTPCNRPGETGFAPGSDRVPSGARITRPVSRRSLSGYCYSRRSPADPEVVQVVLFTTSFHLSEGEVQARVDEFNDVVRAAAQRQDPTGTLPHGLVDTLARGHVGWSAYVVPVSVPGR